MKTSRFYHYPNGCYYLNNTGSRWVVFNNHAKEQTVIELPDGTRQTRTILYFESFGNFAVACISYKGVKACYFMDRLDDQTNGIRIDQSRHIKH